MSLLETIFEHKRLKVFFTAPSDIVEILMGISSFLIAMQILVDQYHLSFSYRVDGLIIPSFYIFTSFLLLSVSQLFAFYNNDWNWRRKTAILGSGLWVFFFILLFYGYRTSDLIVHRNSIPYLTGLLANTWIYLRLGLLKDGCCDD